MEPQLAANRSVYLVLLSRWLTNRVMILHSSSSKIAKKVWILARTLANPSAVPTILHSKGRITYLPSFSVILGAQTMLLTCTSPLIAIALQKGTSIVYPILWRRQIQLCLNTVRRVDCHLSQESSPTAWYLWAPTMWAHPGAVPFPPQWTYPWKYICQYAISIRRFQVRSLFNVACEGSHMRNFGRLVVESTLYPPPFQGVVPTQHSSTLRLGPYCGLTVHEAGVCLPEPRPLGDPVDSDPTPPWSPQPKLRETSEKVQVTPDTVTTLAFITEEPTVWSVWSLATHTRTLTVSQDTIKGRKSSPKDVGRGGGYYTHPYDPFISLGGEGDVEWTFLTCRTSKPFISPNSKDNDQPRKVNLTPLSMNNSGTLRKENSVCPHAGVHRTCLTINGIEHRRERLLTPSHQGVDGAVACRPRSISWHVQVPKDSTNWPARE